MKKTLVYTVAFPQTDKYYKEIFNSLNGQDTCDFDFLIVRENVNIDIYLQGFNVDIKIIDVIGETTPIKNRMLAINYGIDNKYENIIAIDIDDVMDKNRISKIIRGLSKCDIYVHDLRIINEDSRVIKKSFINSRVNNDKILDFQDIMFYNFIGFGNMGFKSEWIKRAFPIPKEIIAVDWWIASTMLLEGAKAIYSDEVLISYRQYDNNIASLEIDSVEIFLKQLEVVYWHYHNILKRYDLLEKSEFYNSYIKITSAMSNKDRKKLAREIINEDTKQVNPMFWWEKVHLVLEKGLI
ncbi:MAG: hypothetical protein RR645_01570 [Clostridium sp.]